MNLRKRINLNSKFNRTALMAIGLCLFSVGLRGWYEQTHVNFAQDQARDLMVVRDLAREGAVIISYGSKASVSDFRWPPLYYQLILWVGLLTNFNPLASHWLIIAVESATPVFLYLLLRYLVADTIAWLTAVLYISSPLTTAFASFSWNPNIIPFFTVTSIYWWFTYYFKRKAWALVLGSCLPLIGFQLHFQAALIILFYFGFMAWVIIKNPKDIRYIFLGWLITLISYSPYIYGEVTHHYENTLKIWHFFTVNHAQIYDRVTLPQFGLNYIPGFLERVLVGVNQPYLWLGRSVLFGGLIIVGWLTAKRPKKYLIIGFLVASMLVMVRVYKGDKLDYYLSAIFGLAYFLLALMFNQLKRLGVALLVILTGFSLHQTLIAPQHDDYKDLEQVVAYLKGLILSNLSVTYKEKDYEYPIQYGLEQLRVTINSDAPVKMTVCNLNQDCGTGETEHEVKSSDDWQITQTDKMIEPRETVKIFGHYKISIMDNR